MPYQASSETNRRCKRAGKKSKNQERKDKNVKKKKKSSTPSNACSIKCTEHGHPWGVSPMLAISNQNLANHCWEESRHARMNWLTDSRIGREWTERMDGCSLSSGWGSLVVSSSAGSQVRSGQAPGGLPGSLLVWSCCVVCVTHGLTGGHIHLRSIGWCSEFLTMDASCNGFADICMHELALHPHRGLV